MSLTTQRLKVLAGEPVIIVSAAQAALVMAVTFGWAGFLGLHSQDDVALVAVALNGVAGVYLAVATAHAVLAPAVELVKALAALGVIYGFHLTTEQTGSVVAFLTVLAALWHRTQTSPSPPAPQTEPRP